MISGCSQAPNDSVDLVIMLEEVLSVVSIPVSVPTTISSCMRATTPRLILSSHRASNFPQEHSIN
jgi:hypothetical protein